MVGDVLYANGQLRFGNAQCYTSVRRCAKTVPKFGRRTQEERTGIQSKLIVTDDTVPHILQHAFSS